MTTTTTATVTVAQQRSWDDALESIGALPQEAVSHMPPYPPEWWAGWHEAHADVYGKPPSRGPRYADEDNPKMGDHREAVVAALNGWQTAHGTAESAWLASGL